MIYLTLMVILAVLTLLDAFTTVVGLRVGCVELNPLVGLWGVELWVVFRMFLLGCMLTTFLVGYRFCSKFFPKGVWMLGATLFMLNVYIGTVVFLGLMVLYLHLIVLWLLIH